MVASKIHPLIIIYVLVVNYTNPGVKDVIHIIDVIKLLKAVIIFLYCCH